MSCARPVISDLHFGQTLDGRPDLENRGKIANFLTENLERESKSTNLLTENFGKDSKSIKVLFENFEKDSKGINFLTENLEKRSKSANFLTENLERGSKSTKFLIENFEKDSKSINFLTENLEKESKSANFLNLNKPASSAKKMSIATLEDLPGWNHFFQTNLDTMLGKTDFGKDVIMIDFAYGTLWGCPSIAVLVGSCSSSFIFPLQFCQ